MLARLSGASYAEMQFMLCLLNRVSFLLFTIDYLHDRNFVKLSDYAGKLLVIFFPTRSFVLIKMFRFQPKLKT